MVLRKSRLLEESQNTGVGMITCPAGQEEMVPAWRMGTVDDGRCGNGMR